MKLKANADQDQIQIEVVLIAKRLVDFIIVLQKVLKDRLIT